MIYFTCLNVVLPSYTKFVPANGVPIVCRGIKSLFYWYMYGQLVGHQLYTVYLCVGEYVCVSLSVRGHVTIFLGA